MKKDVEKAFNPKPPLKFFDCTIVYVANLKSERDGKYPKKGAYDVLMKTKPNKLKPNGAGGTLQKGGGKMNPSSGKMISITPKANGKLNPKVSSHEAGHALGVMDTKAGKQGEWDKNGIKNKHIKEAFKNGSFKIQGRIQGFAKSALCCIPVKERARYFKDVVKIARLETESEENVAYAAARLDDWHIMEIYGDVEIPSIRTVRRTAVRRTAVRKNVVKKRPVRKIVKRRR